MRPIKKTVKIYYILINKTHLIKPEQLYKSVAVDRCGQMMVFVFGPQFPHFLCLIDELFTSVGLRALSWEADVIIM
jgi:hypothetical protein